METLQEKLAELEAAGAESTDIEELQGLIDDAQSDYDDAQAELETLQIEAEKLEDDLDAL